MKLRILLLPCLLITFGSAFIESGAWAAKCAGKVVSNFCLAPHANLTGANLSHTNLTGAVMDGVICPSGFPRGVDVVKGGC